MRENKGRLRLFGVFAAAVCVIGYQVFIFSGQSVPAQAPFSDSVVYKEEETKTPEQPRENKTEKEKTVSKEEAISAAADNSVKGKVITRYISPYSASLSYDGVYLKNSTSLSVDIKKLLSSPLSVSVKKSEKPQVLILHTHTTETYLPEDSDTYSTSYTSRSRDPKKNMISVGDIVAKKLNDAGIQTIHDVTEHDYPQYTGSYGRAATTITKYLKKYPSIQIVLDLHRDAISSGKSDKVKLVTEIGGKKAAQVMLVMGSQSGGVSNFPNWKENLKLAVRLQQVMEREYPTLARPISLMPKNYNESLTKGSLLIEFGTDANSLSEAHTSAELVGNCLVKLFLS